MDSRRSAQITVAIYIYIHNIYIYICTYLSLSLSLSKPLECLRLLFGYRHSRGFYPGSGWDLKQS